MKRRYKKSTYLPILLLIYLAIMSYIGFEEFKRGNYLYYFGIIGATLLAILLLRLSLKRKERLQEEREKEMKDDE
ncbi:MAG: hypothetical protein RR061_06715 [Muribaculaceae bacterium]